MHGFLFFRDNELPDRYFQVDGRWHIEEDLTAKSWSGQNGGSVKVEATVRALLPWIKKKIAMEERKPGEVWHVIR
jgi:hypothetical protein